MKNNRITTYSGKTTDRMKLLKTIITTALLIVTTLGWSQQETTITQFSQFMNVINPAYAGATNQSTLSTAIRSQWTGVDEAPETQFLAFSTGLRKNVGIGFSAHNDRTFVEKQSSVALDFSYRLQVASTGYLHFGLKASGNFYNVNAAGLQTYGVTQDPSLANINQFSPNIGVGFYYVQDALQLSFAMPRLLSSERTSAENGLATISSSRPHLYATASYNIELNNTQGITLQPALLFRYVSGAPVVVDLNTMLKFEQGFAFGGSYRSNNAYAAMANLTVNSKMTLGFAYEMNGRAELASLANTNEILIKYTF